jgi:hypothetical protein
MEQELADLTVQMHANRRKRDFLETICAKATAGRSGDAFSLLSARIGAEGAAQRLKAAVSPLTGSTAPALQASRLGGEFLDSMRPRPITAQLLERGALRVPMNVRVPIALDDPSAGWGRPIPASNFSTADVVTFDPTFLATILGMAGELTREPAALPVFDRKLTRAVGPARHSLRSETDASGRPFYRRV